MPILGVHIRVHLGAPVLAERQRDRIFKAETQPTSPTSVTEGQLVRRRLLTSCTPSKGVCLTASFIIGMHFLQVCYRLYNVAAELPKRTLH